MEIKKYLLIRNLLSIRTYGKKQRPSSGAIADIDWDVHPVPWID